MAPEDKKNPDSKNQNYLGIISKCLAIAVSTKNNNWDKQQYIDGVIKPYEKIQKMYKELKESNRTPSEAQIREAIEMLQNVFLVKKTPLDEQVYRFNQFLNETPVIEIIADFKEDSFVNPQRDIAASESTSQN